MFCRNCGKEIQEGVLFCKFCGKQNPAQSQENVFPTQKVKEESLDKKQDFFERDSIKGTDNADSVQVKRQWSNFVKLFWLLFVFKLISKGAETAQDESIVLVLVILQFVAIIGMVILMGYFSYKFSGKKSYWLFGLLGLLWIAIIGIFLGFFQVQRLKNQRLGVKTSMKSFRLSK